MERAVSGRCADFSGIVEAGSGGGGEAPTGGLAKPTTAPRIENGLSARYPPVVLSLGETKAR